MELINIFKENEGLNVFDSGPLGVDLTYRRPEEVIFMDIKIRAVDNGYVFEGLIGNEPHASLVFKTVEELFQHLKDKTGL